MPLTQLQNNLSRVLVLVATIGAAVPSVANAFARKAPIGPCALGSDWTSSDFFRPAAGKGDVLVGTFIQVPSAGAGSESTDAWIIRELRCAGS